MLMLTTATIDRRNAAGQPVRPRPMPTSRADRPAAAGLVVGSSNLKPMAMGFCFTAAFPNGADVARPEPLKFSSFAGVDSRINLTLTYSRLHGTCIVL